MITTTRLFFSSDRRRVVPEGHRDAAFLFAAPGDEIPESDVERYGLKAVANTPNKAAAQSPNKGVPLPARK
jgi:hypothetical protein